MKQGMTLDRKVLPSKEYFLPGKMSNSGCIQIGTKFLIFYFFKILLF